MINAKQNRFLGKYLFIFYSTTERGLQEIVVVHGSQLMNESTLHFLFKSNLELAINWKGKIRCDFRYFVTFLHCWSIRNRRSYWHPQNTLKVTKVATLFQFSVFRPSRKLGFKNKFDVGQLWLVRYSIWFDWQEMIKSAEHFLRQRVEEKNFPRILFCLDEEKKLHRRSTSSNRPKKRSTLQQCSRKIEFARIRPGGKIKVQPFLTVQ